MNNKDEEMLDLVNEQDEVIGEVLKVKANQDPSLWHREIAVILFDNDNNVLFQKRSKNKTVSPGKWTISCAGHVTKGMTPEEAAHMELKEELGIDANLIFLGKVLYRGQNETHFTYWYIGKYTGEPICIQKEEVERYAFLNRKGLMELIKDDERYSGSVKWACRFWEGEFDEKIRILQSE